MRQPIGFAAFAAVLLFNAGCGSSGKSDPQPSCAFDSVLCGQSCVRPAADVQNCGTCGNACEPGQVCSAGQCAASCAAPLATCGSGEAAFCADTRNDPAHCGGCDTACPAGQLCSAGQCAVTCTAPLATCGSGEAAFCADTRNDPNHCGSCDSACPAGQVCAAGECAVTCEGTGSTLCGDRCVDLQSDDAHCGSCENACGAGTSCHQGECAPTCPPGQARCGDRCVDLATDEASCGACGHACPANAFCVAGSCEAPACPAGFGLPGQPDLVGNRAYSINAADLDGDGLPDLVASNYPSTDSWDEASSIQVLRNLGGRRFAPPVVYEVGFEPLAVRLGDVNGDGIADALVVGEGKLAYLRGRGDGTFHEAVGRAFRHGTRTEAALADLDGDGRLDLIAAGAMATVARGGVSGPQAPETYSTPWPWSEAYAVAAGDLDGNGMPDVVLGFSSARVGVYLNPGTGGLSGAPASWFEVPGEVTSVAVADVDGDGDLDVLAAVLGYGDWSGLAVSLNDGTGVLGTPALYPTTWGPYSMAVADLDGDGRPEAALGNWGDSRQVDLLRNAGDGTFLPSEPYFEEGAAEIAQSDLDGDGRPDLAVASGPGMGIHILWNAGGGRLEQPALQPATGVQGVLEAVTLADLDGDGVLDAVATDSQQGKLFTFRGRGGGVLEPGQVLDAPSALAVLAGDLDGDGALDLVVPRGDDAQVFLSRGGSFQPGQTVDRVDGLDGVALADLDGDGWLDLVGYSTALRATAWWRGLEDGTFDGPTSIDTMSGEVLVADVDRNGWQDVVRVSPGTVYVTLGLGGGAFAPTVSSPLGTTTSLIGVAAADLDGDGRTDLAIADRYDDRVGLMLGRGDGTFEPPQWQPFYAEDSIATATIPGMGRSVLLVRSGLAESVGVFEVDSSRVLQPPRRWTALGGVGLLTGGIAVGDLDGDVRPDVVLGAPGGLAVLPSRCFP